MYIWECAFLLPEHQKYNPPPLLFLSSTCTVMTGVISSRVFDFVSLMFGFPSEFMILSFHVLGFEGGGSPEAPLNILPSAFNRIDKVFHVVSDASQLFSGLPLVTDPFHVKSQQSDSVG